MLHAYFDETGDSNDSTILGMGGCIASLGAWHHFEEEWKEKILKKYGLEFFHMTDFDGYNGSYERDKGWTEERHEECMNTLIHIISQTVHLCIGVIRQLPEQRKFERSDDPYFDCFERCIMFLLAQRPFGTDELLHVFIARKDKFKGRTEDIFARIVSSHKLAEQHLVGLTIPSTPTMTKKDSPFSGSRCYCI